MQEEYFDLLNEASNPLFKDSDPSAPNVDHNPEEKAYHQNPLFLDEDDYTDEDEKLFDQQNEQITVAKIQESIDDLLEKGKRKTLKYEELMQHQAKSVLLMSFARAFALNQITLSPMNRAMVLSLIPQSYQGKYMDRSFNIGTHRQYIETLNDIITNFNALFIPYLDSNLQCIIDKDQSFIEKLMFDKKLSLIEYLLLFSIFLNLHKLIHRVNFIIDISAMENSKQIKVSRKKPQIKDAPDRYQYGMQQQANKKRKYNDFFAERKIQINSDDNDDEKVVKQEFKKFKLNETEAQTQETLSINQNFFEQFAFKGNGKSRSKQQAANQVLTKRMANEIESSDSDEIKGKSENSSNLFVKDDRFHHVNQNFDKKTDKVHALEFVDAAKNTEQTFSDGLFIEVYDETSHTWHVCCPITNKVYTNKGDVQKYFKNRQILFILATQSYKSYESLRELENQSQLVFLRDIGITYVNDKDMKEFLKAKNSCILSRSVEDFINRFAPYISYYADSKVAKIIRYEEQSIERAEMQFIPSTLSEFKNNKYYTLPSLIRKYQGFFPQAQPLEGKNFKGEPIFLKKDLTELHTVERWRKHGRQVKLEEQPIKRVKGLYNEPEKMAELYGFWQTIPFRNELTEDGKIPRVLLSDNINFLQNQYGNIEIFNGPLPENTIHIDLPKVALICRKLNIEHVSAVVGFEKAGGKSHPCVQGVVTFKQYEKQIIEEYESMNSQSKIKARERINKKAKKVWKQLIKSILVKKYISQTYETNL